MERKNTAAARLGIETVGEAGFDAGALIEQRQRPDLRGQFGRKALAVLFRLDFDPGQRDAFLLGFDYPSCFTIDIEEIVREAVSGDEREVAESDAASSIHVRVLVVLDIPPSFL